MSPTARLLALLSVCTRVAGVHGGEGVPGVVRDEGGPGGAIPVPTQYPPRTGIYCILSLGTLPTAK